MSYAIDQKECMFFVGGNAAKSTNPVGSALAGGCTKAWWNSQPNIDTVTGKQTAMGLLMSSTGAPIYSEWCDYYADNGSGKARLYVSTVCSAVKAGMLLFCDPTDDATGAGAYEVIDVDASGYWIDIDHPYSSITAADFQIDVGGAWSGLESLMDSYVDASEYPQEVWVNKDLSPTVQWDLSNWSGVVITNSWVTITGFHRVPGDITESNGAYYQTVKDMFDNGVDSDCLVDVDYSGMGTTALMSPGGSENIRISGFSFNTTTTNGKLNAASSAYYNLVFAHNTFVNNATWALDGSRNFLAYDNLIARNPLEIFSDLLDMSGAVFTFLSNYFKDIDKIGDLYYTSTGSFRGNVFDIVHSCSDRIIVCDTDARIYSENNTFIGFDGADGVLASVNTDGHITSINDLFYNEGKDNPAYHLGFLAGTIIAINPCAYAENGQLDEVMTLDPTSPFTTHRNKIFNLLEIDPLLDGDYRPRNKKVLFGGTEVGGQKTTIGAISQEHQFVGRSIKSNPGRLGIFK